MQGSGSRGPGLKNMVRQSGQERVYIVLTAFLLKIKDFCLKNCDSSGHWTCSKLIHMCFVDLEKSHWGIVWGMLWEFYISGPLLVIIQTDHEWVPVACTKSRSGPL